MIISDEEYELWIAERARLQAEVERLREALEQIVPDDLDYAGSVLEQTDPGGMLPQQLRQRAEFIRATLNA